MNDTLYSFACVLRKGDDIELTHGIVEAESKEAAREVTERNTAEKHPGYELFLISVFPVTPDPQPAG